MSIAKEAGVSYHHPWGVLYVHRGYMRVEIRGRARIVELPLDNAKDNVASLEAILDSVFDAGRRAELKHVRETLGIRE